MKDIQEILINNLIALRKARGLTQIELGEHVSYSDKTISKWENGDTCPGIEAIHRLAAFYEVSVDELLREDFRAASAPLHTPGAHQKKIYRRSIIASLALVGVWALATLLFIVTQQLAAWPQAWLLFIDAVPLCCILLLIFNSLWGRRRLNYLILSALLWTALTAIFLHLLPYGLWMLYLLGIPCQLAILLWSLLKKK